MKGTGGNYSALFATGQISAGILGTLLGTNPQEGCRQTGLSPEENKDDWMF